MQSMAMTKLNEQPFSFYERDLQAAEERAAVEPVCEEMLKPPFKSNPVPWFCKVHLYQRMVENDAQEREIRIKAAAEEAYAQAKLPPRMEADEQR